MLPSMNGLCALKSPRLLASLLCLALPGTRSHAEPPGIAYIFPAGGQRGTTVEARVGGYYFHGDAGITLESRGVRAEPRLEEMSTLFFNGPLIQKPTSQGREDYPKDYRARITLAADAPLGHRPWSCSTFQGVTPAMKFVVGDLPELVETEIEGPEDPSDVAPPLTINGRIFPREDTDDWRVVLSEGVRLTCELAARELGSPLQGVLEVYGPDGRQIAPFEHSLSRAGDPRLTFITPTSGPYRIRVRDAAFNGGQSFVYRLTLHEAPRLSALFPLGGRAGEEIPLAVYEPGVSTPATRTLRLPVHPGLHQVELPRGPHHTLLPVDVSVVPEAIRRPSGEVSGLNDGLAPVPSVLNGCILSAGEVHEWQVRLEPNVPLRADVVASALGSRLDSVLSLVDEQGREVTKNDDGPDGRADSSLQYTAPKGGLFTLRIQDRFARRGGPEFGYRLKLTQGDANDFQLRIPADFFNATRVVSEPPPVEGKPAPKPPGLKLEVVGTGGTQKEIRLELEGLPEGVDFEPKVIPAKAKTADLRFLPSAKAAFGVYPIRIRGTLGEGETKLTRFAVVSGTVTAMNPPVATSPLPPMGSSSGTSSAAAPLASNLTETADTGTVLRLAVTPQVPFKFVGEYWVTNDQPAGTSMKRAYRLERGGYAGPLRVMLSDKQGPPKPTRSSLPSTTPPKCNSAGRAASN